MFIEKSRTPVNRVCELNDNFVYVKREDLIPYSFGGNKARKAFLFFQDIDAGNYDCVVTYGSSHSNHCRVIANICAAKGISCYIIGPQEVADETYNSKFMKLFGADLTLVPVNDVHDTIENKLASLKRQGKSPYFIPGGGHGNIGTKAYVQCYEEIKQYEQEIGVFFDYIFFASGTGTTHAGLICGQLLHNDTRKIVGISIARKNPRGRSVVIDSIKEYLPYAEDDLVQESTIFVDKYIGDGYGLVKKEITSVIVEVMKKYGIPLDSTYTGKAFWGMQRYLAENGIKNRNVLFIHTGGTPLFFDDLRNL